MADDGDKGEGQQDENKGQQDDQKEPPKPKARWPWIVASAVVAVFVIVVLLLILLPHARVKTDDAYVTGHYAMVAPRVGGQIASVRVDDNQPVRAGTLLATIDDSQLRAALDQSEANLAAGLAMVDQARAQVARQPSQIRQARAQVVGSSAQLALGRADAARFADLAQTGAGTFQQHQQADATLRQDEASLTTAEANLSARGHELDALLANLEAAKARVAQDRAAVRQAKLNLGYTRIVAPIEGTVAQRTVQVGNFVAPGAPLLMLVPLRNVYVMANYRELDLRHMRPGQPATIHVDAYAIDLAGTVASLPPASGATFSPIPPSNATGNFTKIVQRLPVKIVVSPGQPLARLLRAGLSVEVTVDTGLEDVVGLQRRSGGRVTAP